MFPIWYAPIYTDGLDPEARFPRERYRLVRSGLAEWERSKQLSFVEPEPLDTDLLGLIHEEGYCEDFLNGTLSAEKKRRIGLRPWTEAIVERTLILTNGTVSATRHVCEQDGFAANLGGGTHHAYYDFGSGYCIFNDLAISARVAQREYGRKRILILDLDVHQGDGTAALFEGDPTVETVSFHCGKNFPFRKMVSDLDVVLEEGAGDSAFLSRLEQFLSERAARALPDLILFQGGVDGLATDRLGHLTMTDAGMRTRNALVFEFACAHEIPLVITMGGGYGDPIATSVEAHLDLFRQAGDAMN